MRKGGLEPPRLAALAPKASASANSATFAYNVFSTTYAQLSPVIRPSFVTVQRRFVTVRIFRDANRAISLLFQGVRDSSNPDSVVTSQEFPNRQGAYYRRATFRLHPGESPLL